MEDINPIQESKHQELLKLLNPLIEFMDTHGYSYFFISGKDGVCSRYMRGNFDDLTSILTGMAEKNPQVKVILEQALNDLDDNS